MMTISKKIAELSIDLATADATTTVVIEKIESEYILNAEYVSIKIDWANITGTNNGVLYAKKRLGKTDAFLNENTDETSDNPTQRTLSGTAGSKSINFFPWDGQALQLSFAKGTITGGTILVNVVAKF
jgi:hypothetical protein